MAYNATCRGAQSRLWRPSDAGATLSAWYDFSNSSSVTIVSGAISQINDLSGHGNTMTQSNATNRPSYTAINGLSVASFNGTNNFLVTSTTNTFATGSSSSTVFAVAYSTLASNSKGTIFSYGNTSTAQSRNLTKGPAYVMYSGETNQDSPNSTQTIGTSTLSVVTAVFGSTTVSIGVNGSSFLSNSAVPNTPASQAVYIGELFGTGQQWGGPIAEIVVVNGPLSTIRQQQFEGYLAWKWATTSTILVSHPYKLQPPRVSA